MSRERRLGRGLEALLGRSLDSPSETASEGETGSDRDLVTGESTPEFAVYSGNDSPEVTRSDDGQQWLELGSIDRNPYQPRQQFDEAEIADLCDSIRTHGILQSIVVRKLDGRYQLIAGERRLRAAQLANWERVPVQIRDVDDRQMAELAIVENVQRKDLNALEKAASFQRYLEEYGCTQEELASRVNIDRSTVANLIRLLELPVAVKEMLARGDIAQGHARALLPLGEEHEQIDFAKRIHREGLSVRATESAVQDHIHAADSPHLSVVDSGGASQPAKPSRSEHLAAMEEQLRLALGTKVDLKQTAKGRGRITIHFKTNEQFEQLRSLLAYSKAPAIPRQEAG